MRLGGVIPPVATPFTGEEVAHERFRENLAAYNRVPLGGYVVLGSNGEFPFLSFEEKVACCRTVVEAAAGRPVLAGTGSESIRETIELTRAVAETGVVGALVLHPSYYKGAMDERALDCYYRKVADASPVPVYLYNVPQYSGLNLGPTLVASLASHPNIVGIKDSSGNITQLGEIIHLTRGIEDFAVFAGSGGFFLAALALGAAGGIMAVANVVPRHCRDILDAFADGRWDDARALQGALIPLNNAVTARWGVPGLKAAMDLAGYYGGSPRVPLRPLDPALREQLRSLLSGCCSKGRCTPREQSGR
jgi:4-hydroxy-2-oxoglutarate aldolase